MIGNISPNNQRLICFLREDNIYSEKKKGGGSLELSFSRTARKNVVKFGTEHLYEKENVSLKNQLILTNINLFTTRDDNRESVRKVAASLNKNLLLY